MSDREEITEVLVRYATGIDRRDWELFRTCFTEDCLCDYGDLGSWRSADAITAFMRGAHSGPSMHRLTNFAITLDGDHARARTYVDARVYHRGGNGMHSIGTYDDDLVRTNDGWRIAGRRYTGLSYQFIGLLSFVPASLARRLAAIGARRMAAVTAR